MAQTVQPLTVMDAVAVERYQHLLATHSYDDLVHTAGDLAFLAASDDRSPDAQLARERLPLICAEVESRPEAQAAARRRVTWCVAAVLERRRRRPSDWHLVELPPDAPLADGACEPHSDLTCRNYTPDLAYLAFRGRAPLVGGHRLILKEDAR